MTELTYPGVYTQRKSSGPGAIRGVSTSNLGLIGFSPKGKVDYPVLSTSFTEFSSKFGSFTDKGLSAHMAYAFFANEGRQLYFVRVAAPDAVSSYQDLAANVIGEDLGSDVQATGVYDLQLEHMPVIPSSLVITFGNAVSANKNVFRANSSGVLTLDTTLSGASAAGGSGSVDMDTGELHVELNNPAQFTGGANKILVNYSYAVFRFELLWPGEYGDRYRVRITQGNDDFLTQNQALWSRFNILLDENKSDVPSRPSWVNVKTWANLVMDDIDSPNYITNVINNDTTMANEIRVIDYGNGMRPVSLQGASVTGENIGLTQLPVGSSLTAPVSYDGATKAWRYLLNDSPFKRTTTLSFKMADGHVEKSGICQADSAMGILTDATANFTNGGADDNLVGMIVVNKTDKSTAIISANDDTTVTGALVGGTVAEWETNDEYIIVQPTTKIGIGTGVTGAGVEKVISPGSTSMPVSIIPGSVSAKVTMSTAGTVLIVDNGAGDLLAKSDTSGVVIGSIDYTTGQIESTDSTLNELNFAAAWSGENVVAGTPILFGCVYDVPITLSDDPDGNMSINTPLQAGAPRKFSLNHSSGVNKVDYDTGYITLTWKIEGNPSLSISGAYSQLASYYTNPEYEIVLSMDHGDDGSSLTSSDIVGPSLVADKRGLFAFSKVDEMMTLVVSDFQTDVYVADALVTYCERMGDKFAILTVPYGLSYQEAVNWKKFQLNINTAYAALYYPHIRIMDPVSGVNVAVPVGGHVAGAYARTDAAKNVGKAPAGVGDGNLRWTTGLEYDLTREQVGIVYPNKINALVQWEETGRVVWGARTLDISGGEWPYIQTNRLFMFCEKSVYKATHGYIFQNNGPGLWMAVRTQVTSFLTSLHNSGYFAGKTADESFFVICDSTNNTPETVALGEVYCDVGIAGNKPGEFLVFRFQQKALS